MNKRQIGDVWESFVTDFLIHNGMCILERNFYSRHGEIDIIFKDGDYIVFAEVKIRNGKRYGYSQEAVTYKKIQHILYAAKAYLYIHKYSQNTLVRFDVITVQDGVIDWIKNAFDNLA